MYGLVLLLTEHILYALMDSGTCVLVDKLKDMEPAKTRAEAEEVD